MTAKFGPSYNQPRGWIAVLGADSPRFTTSGWQIIIRTSSDATIEDSASGRTIQISANS